jgi:hypothetical protein
MDEGIGSGRWQDDLYDLLRRNNVTQFAYVPDAGHRILIDRSLADPEVHSVALTSEEEGVAMLAGADLGGARGVLLMQSSGTGNCANMRSRRKKNSPVAPVCSARAAALPLSCCASSQPTRPPSSERWIRPAAATAFARRSWAPPNTRGRAPSSR